MRTTRLKRGFSLVEIVIVSALIALLSGIAIFSINEFYNSNIKKAVIGECNQLATSMSFAHDDLQFFPRLNFLNQPGSGIFINEATGLQDPTRVVTAVDYYGYIPGGTPLQFPKIRNGWSGPYLGQSATRNRSSRGNRSGIIKMRVPDVYLALSGPSRDTFSLVEWPADVWGNPYVFYQMRSSTDAGGNLIPLFVRRPEEEGDYLNAVVSYGRNGCPGGNENLVDTSYNTLFAGALYVKGDAMVSGGPADFTLKVISQTVPPNLRLESAFNPNHLPVLESLSPASPYPPTGFIGMLQPGNDDIVYEF